MKSQYMRYESGAEKVLRPLSVKRSDNINKMSSGQIIWHLYERHSIIVWQVLATLAFTWAFVNKLG